MRLKTARVQNYRSIRDTGVFEIENAKTILVGPNEAGKSAILQALQQINAPPDIKKFDSLRDYPRALLNDIDRGLVDPDNVPVATVIFTLDGADQEAIPARFRECGYSCTRFISNGWTHHLTDAPSVPNYGDIKDDLANLADDIDRQAEVVPDGTTAPPTQASLLKAIVGGWSDQQILVPENTLALRQWLQGANQPVNDRDSAESLRSKRLHEAVDFVDDRNAALKTLYDRRPVFVLFSNYFRVRPRIHLPHLAQRLATNTLDDSQFDYGNSCLLSFLGFNAQDLADLGSPSEPVANQSDQIELYQAQLDKRSYQLNSASVKLTSEIRRVWNPLSSKNEADKLHVRADGHYLKVVVEDDLGVEVELDQRSEGFQWLVSFFVVFFAETENKHANAILLLDEPGLSLHALKQREFRKTVSLLSEKNQTIYTTHSPFLVGPDELDLVRVVELSDRTSGTKVHTSVTSNDPAALLPLQEALGYDLAQSLFTHERNLVLEGLTDYWYVEAVAGLLAAAGTVTLNDKIALIPAGSAGKVAYFATFLHANKLKVAALLDSDNAGDHAAQQEVLVHK